ncbi:hypothetical protein ACSU64_27625 [Bacillaceae bacterium C204]|uniref:hypothetical protein n=1 Tax=Neobacillus sp. 204 TaxID=3383351 RepID=UPI00397C9737
MVTYHLDEQGITFFVDGIIVFDCPVQRMKAYPDDAIKAMQHLEAFWQRKFERG